jgi:hypothetical protein
MSEEVYGHLCDISRVRDKIADARGVHVPYMPIQPKFVEMLHRDGFIPSFDHVRGYGFCWVWLIWDNLRIISTI